MKNPINMTEFPINALGVVLGAAVWEATLATGNTVSSNAVAMLAGASLCAQGLVEVEKRPGLVSPIGQYFAAILPSGERKTASLQIALAPVRAFSTEAAAQHRAAIAQFDAEMSAWRAEERGIQIAIRRRSENDEDVEAERERLREHAQHRPRKPKRLKLIHENVTPTALWTSLAESQPTTSLISDEGQVIISSRALSDPGLLNKAWDAGTLLIDRATAGELVIEKPALTMLLQFQPGVFQTLIDKKGQLLRDSGFFARCFIIAPPPMAGSRFLAYAPETAGEDLRRYHERCKQLLQMHHLDDNGELLPRQTLRFLAEAQARWDMEHDQIEAAMQDGGYFFCFRDFASKLTDKIARLAALLHFFDGHEGEISRETLERAIVIAQWFAAEYVRICTPPPVIPEAQQNAVRIRDWLVNHYQTTGSPFVRKNDALQLGPNAIRSKAALNEALSFLRMWGQVVEWKAPEDRKTYIGLTREFIAQIFPPR